MRQRLQQSASEWNSLGPYNRRMLIISVLLLTHLIYHIYRHESKCIQEIVGVIMSKLGDTVSSDMDNLVGVGCRMEKMISLLAMGVEDVRIVGIYGVSGIGKTTIAKVTFDKISDLFEGCSFLHEVGESSKKSGRQSLQEKLLSEILMERDVKIKNVFEGINVTKQRLRHKKVFVVLDDVDHADQLEALAGNHDWFGQGSRIIITTRNKSLLYRIAVDETDEVSALNDNEATQLFQLNAFKKSHAEEEYDDKLSYHVVKFAGGLPLAIKVLGSFLGDTDNTEGVLRKFTLGGLLSAGPWGGEGGAKWSYKPRGAIVKIVVGHGLIIDSIMFGSKNEDGSQEYSPKFGGDGESATEIVFDSPSEYLTGISLTYGTMKGVIGFISVTSILLRTNVRKYGRFGSETGISASLPLKGGTIVGFYGRSGLTVDALGIYARPKGNASCAPSKFKDLHSFLRDRDKAERGSALGGLHKLEEDEILRQFSTWDAISLCVGPWGGEGGGEWNYEPSGAITKIVIGHGVVIDSIIFIGKNDDGLVEYSPKFGGNGGSTTQIDFDHPSEYLIGISLTYGTGTFITISQTGTRNDVLSITSLRFITNVKAYGPFGSETGTFASFPSTDSVITGFHGRAGLALDAIGIYVKPKYS
ncbi:hypothetical protein RJ640_002637 [Escallonia rubra]|uniref:Jacalin-type lectin domain-containing protein n=1 Tax=Escallonia rubra TaxID=112253 RepID=A0AA88R9W4_9ASTE|nr:hypothetical protein RJ640_002637 [Escallonia rubra]